MRTRQEGRRGARPSCRGAVLTVTALVTVVGCTQGAKANTATSGSPVPSPLRVTASSPMLGSPAATVSTSSAAVAVGGPANTLQQQYESVIAQVLPSVVQITTSSGLGSGIVYDSAGDIVTNDHVVGSATAFQVQFSSSAKPVAAKLVGTFPAGDLAVIRVSGIHGLHPAAFADSAHAEVGQIVLAIGNPLGLSGSVTEGIVSAVGRTLTEPQDADSPGATLPDSIQTSAAINPGNSGGALVDLSGKVLGIPTLAATDQQEGGAAPGIGFAIPSNTVRHRRPVDHQGQGDQLPPGGLGVDRSPGSPTRRQRYRVGVVSRSRPAAPPLSAG